MATKQPVTHGTKGSSGSASKVKPPDSTGSNPRSGLDKPPSRRREVVIPKGKVYFKVAPTKEQLMARATDVFANEEKALRWLGTPIRALDYATPISLLSEPKGRFAVLRVLNKIEHGVF